MIDEQEVDLLALILKLFEDIEGIIRLHHDASDPHLRHLCFHVVVKNVENHLDVYT